jgi:hypothetical protein
LVEPGGVLGQVDGGDLDQLVRGRQDLPARVERGDEDLLVEFRQQLRGDREDVR